MLDPLSVPLRLGAYEPLLELASGGMATVYIARQVGAAGFERIVVVKRVHRHLLGNREFYDMFRDEARVASMVRHPNVVPVIDVVEIRGEKNESELFLVMEYVESSSLSTLRKAAHESAQRIPVPVVARILYDAIGGLNAAHNAVDMQGHPLGVVHRDVSPQNIIVGVDGSSRLIDFGVAKASHRLTETKSGSVKGKYSYMAPEQARGQAVDRRTDIFAAGVVLHECLTDKRLFRGDNELDTVRRIMEAEIPVPSSIQPALPTALDAVVLRALERPPEKRFQTAVDMMEALEHAMPLASHREVAAYLERVCGSRLQERREALREMLAGHVAPLTFELSKEPGESQPSRSVRLDGGAIPKSTTPAPESSGTEGRIAVEAMRAPDSRSRVPLIAAVSVAAIAVAALAIVLSLKSPQTTQPTQTNTTVVSVASATAPAPSTTETAPPNTDVVVSLTAESSIAIVHVQGAEPKRVDITGKIAKVTLDPWTSPLKVEATLENGKKVVSSLEPGETSAHLAPAKHTNTVATTTATTTATRPDLQGSPY